jgi:L-asparagine transporter-like permease
MDWIIALAFFGFCWWRVARARERTSELAATGILRSPLYWVSNALVAVLLALVLYIAHIHNQSPVPAFLWFAVLAIIVALLFLRRALKGRYPV